MSHLGVNLVINKRRINDGTDSVERRTINLDVRINHKKRILQKGEQTQSHG